MPLSSTMRPTRTLVGMRLSKLCGAEVAHLGRSPSTRANPQILVLGILHPGVSSEVFEKCEAMLTGICHGFVSEPVFGFTSLPLVAVWFLF